ncbi:MAG TPA: hypothetical protein VKU39_12720 [Streptosporangiaceae bacterium]|nr:hypothetical protein [Streptosporangiaceae bacterium]
MPAATGGDTGPGADALRELRDVCDAAVAATLAVDPDLLIVVGSGPATVRYPRDAVGTLAPFGVPRPFGEAVAIAALSQNTHGTLPLSLTIGAWLVERAPLAPLAAAVQLRAIAADADPAECQTLGAELAAQAGRVAILAMGDGPGRRARRAPGAVDEAADRYDSLVTTALATGNPRDLANLNPADDVGLFVAGRTAWQVLAGATSPDTPYTGTVHYAAAPFEVSYYVATLRMGA